MSNIFDEMINTFTEQRRAVPKVFDLRNRIVELTKKGMIAILHNDLDLENEIVKKIFDLWNELGQLRLPVPTGSQFDSDAGQEIVEFFFVSMFFNLMIINVEICGNNTISYAISNFNVRINDAGIPLQIILRGMVDGVTELSRMLIKYIVWSEITDRSERIRLRKRYIRIAEWMNSYFEKVEMNSIPMVVDAYNNRGFRNSFRSVLNRVRGAIEYQYRLLEQEIVSS